MRHSVQCVPGAVSVLLLIGCLASPPAAASIFEPVSDRQLVCEATAIVRGQVTDVQSAWDDQHQAIWTTATVQVDDVLRGNLSPGGLLQVKEVGGTAGGYTIVAEDFPTFQAGEEVVMLLRPWEDGSGTHRVWGYGRGLFIVEGGRGIERTASRHDVARSGVARLHTDRIPPTAVLGALSSELSTLARRCAP